MRTPEAGGKQAEMAQSLLASFTSVVGIVIAFYFGATAYIDGRKAGADTQEPNPRSSESAAK